MHVGSETEPLLYGNNNRSGEDKDGDTCTVRLETNTSSLWSCDSESYVKPPIAPPLPSMKNGTRKKKLGLTMLEARQHLIDAIETQLVFSNSFYRTRQRSWTSSWHWGDTSMLLLLVCSIVRFVTYWMNEEERLV